MANTPPKRTIAYINFDAYIDTDLSVLKELYKYYNIIWYALLESDTAYSKEYLETQVKNTDIELHVIEYRYRRRSFSYFKMIWNIVSQIKKKHPSLLYTCCMDVDLCIISKIKLYNIPKVLGVHDVISHSNNNLSLFFKLSRKIVIRYNHFFVNFSKSQFDLNYKLYPHKKNFNVGMSVKNFGAPNTSKPIFDTERRILFFGTLQTYKGFDLLIDAYERICKEGVSNIRVSFYGKPVNQKIRNLLFSKISVKTRYNLHLDFVDNNDIANIFNSHHFAIFPYRDATQSGPLMIAVNYQIPIIAPQYGCFTDIVENNVNGLLYDSTSQDGLYLLLKNISKMSSAEYEQLIKLSKIVSGKYSETEICKNYTSVFDTLIKEEL